MNSGRLENHQYADPELAIEYLGEMLKQGSLALVLGAGISSGIGLPGWLDLVKGCLKSAGLPDNINKKTPNEQLLKKVDEVERKFSDAADYLKAVHNVLYSNCKFDINMFKHPLLVAIGAMVMGGQRGTVREILTLNFDNVLEYYLKLYGITADVIYKLPSLRKEKDVAIYHPHGFLPREDFDSFSDFLILSQFSYHQRLGDTLNNWKELTKDLFRRKVVLFIGLSGDDVELMSLLTSLESELRPERPTGFWLFGNKVDEEDFFRRNAIPITLNDHDAYPQFLLRICQHAANL